MGRCRDCTWWGQDSDKFWVSDLRHPTKYRYCELTMWDGQQPDYATSAYAIDADNSFGVLLTAPDFGCVQFEPRDPA